MLLKMRFSVVLVATVFSFSMTSCRSEQTTSCDTPENSDCPTYSPNQNTSPSPTNSSGPSPLTALNAVATQGRGGVTITWTFPSATGDYKKFSLERTPGSTSGACGSQTSVYSVVSNFSGTSSFSDVPGPGTFTYRACIEGQTGSLTSSNISGAITTSLNYLIFLTSSLYDGNLLAPFNSVTFATGTEGADYRCQYHADQAQLGGKFAALVSSSTSLAPSRVTGLGGVVKDLAGNTFIDATASSFWTQLSASNDSCAINPVFSSNTLQHDEYGSSVGVSEFWSGTSITNNASPSHCSNWSVSSVGTLGSAGNTSCTSNLWVEFGNRTCDSMKRLVCINL
jgi:hypothetical protein